MIYPLGSQGVRHAPWFHISHHDHITYASIPSSWRSAPLLHLQQAEGPLNLIFRINVLPTWRWKEAGGSTQQKHVYLENPRKNSFAELNFMHLRYLSMFEGWCFILVVCDGWCFFQKSANFIGVSNRVVHVERKPTPERPIITTRCSKNLQVFPKRNFTNLDHAITHPNSM